MQHDASVCENTWKYKLDTNKMESFSCLVLSDNRRYIMSLCWDRGLRRKGSAGYNRPQREPEHF
jgi:hypothetical protein